MSDRHQDPELLARFEEQKRIDAGNAPPFAAVLARAQAELAPDGHTTTQRDPRVALRRVGWASALAAAATIAALLLIPRDSSDDAFEQAVQAFQADPALGAWRSPTDGLLNLPGSQLMSAVPSIGSVQ